MSKLGFMTDPVTEVDVKRGNLKWFVNLYFSVQGLRLSAVYEDKVLHLAHCTAAALLCTALHCNV